MTVAFAATCPFCSAALPPDDPNGDRHTCAPVEAERPAEEGPRTVLDAARWVARELGGYVFPVDHPSLPTCAGLHGPHAPCDGKRGKHPSVRFSLDATNTDRDIVATFAGATRNYGVETRRSHLLIIDEDTATLASYAADIGQAVPETFEVSTGRGRHLWFRMPNGVELTNGRGRLPKGIDVRAGSYGFVVGPGSLHANGNTYEATWTRRPATAPQWLIDALAPEPSDRPAGNEGSDVIPETARILIAAPVEDVDRSERFHAIVGACRAGGMSLAATAAALTPWCQRAGKYVGREIEEVERCWPKVDPPDTWTDTLPEEGVEEEADRVVDEDNDPAVVRAALPRIDWHALWADDTEEEWIIEPLLPARRLIALYSPPKVGKSLLMLELAVAVSRGEPALGVSSGRPRRVLYVDFENDPKGDIRERLIAMGRGPDDLDNLVYLSFPSLAALDSDRGGRQLVAAVDAYECEVVVIDTVSRAISGEENDNDTWLAFYRHTGKALKAKGIALVRLDHTGKDETRGQRGGSAKSGDVDAVWRMSEMVRDKTYRLECEANRMPVAEKTLVIHRETRPLRHRVDSAGRAAVWSIKEREAIQVLKDAGVPLGAGRSVCREAIKSAGLKLSNELLSEVIKKRGGIDSD